MNVEEEYPRMMMEEDMQESAAMSTAILASMIQDSIRQQVLPPAEIWQWYVKHIALSFVLIEYNAVYNGNSDSAAQMELIRIDLEEVRDALITNKQFGLQAEFERILKTRLLHLPAGYIATLDQVLR